MASKEQILAVASNCSEFNPLQDQSAFQNINITNWRRSCEMCKHWTETGKCNINVFDKVLTGLDQT